MHDLGAALLRTDSVQPATFEASFSGMAVESGQHITRMKWHRLQRKRSDLPFTPRRLLEGLAVGASMEVGLRLHADHSFVCLHDETLDRETSGTGPIAEASLEHLRWSEPGAGWRLIGALFYLLGSIGLTMVFNVPLNNRLAKAGPESAEGAAIWSHYLSVWTAWNHLRTVGCLGATASFIVGMP